MSYVKATSVLPEELMKEIQKYVQGETVYIPKPKAAHSEWGARSGTRKILDERNVSIKQSFKNGATIDQLVEEYYLSAETIKKIVYSRKS
ncbi:hypothetical protein SAMN05216389_1128 [Oceanobacillus limi]|uniref:Mor transcription activator family protein n=1 Tax=Oceanobacillus limi TaxID=930131 RepID=A0A1I0EQ79_9BACI|nr:CD3324 family protein [Oceanobacillus limi]SET46769.1 hypothetical protein SAMN05216389_1128 [Oceanobacillus limi]